MILLFGKRKHCFHKANVTDTRRVRGANGEDWLVVFQNGDHAGVGIDLNKYDWAYEIDDTTHIWWFKGQPATWRTKRHPDCL